MSGRQLSLGADDLLTRARDLFAELASLPEDARVEMLNSLRFELHKHSPFSSEPVDCVQWIPAEDVIANDYNPNSVAPPEMKLLERSVEADGYTQPIVAWPVNGHYEVVDGFHRNRVGRESPAIRKRIRGYLPLTIINAERVDRGDRIAATIRHNRARGKHKVEAMSEIVVELKRRNWTDDKIARELGMDPDEVLRLTQITGLAELFADQEFSQSWDVESEQAAEVESALLADEAEE
jgi:ParB-like chromosome segregation protein Spo0J